MDPTTQQWRFQKGDKVCSADDADLGKVVALEPEVGTPAHLVVEKGLLAKRSLTVPVSAVCNYADGTIYLDLPRAALEGGG
jgi:hypothetical protein